MTEQPNDFKTIARNRKARRDYEVFQIFETGIELRGSEVKSLRDGKVNLTDAYAVIEAGEVILRNLHISRYPMATDAELDPDRPRRLLLHAREIRKITQKIDQKGMTLIPLSIYFKGKLVKIELALAIGRRKFDKREAIAKADAQRRISQATRRDARR
jgi:SsrA-binding protein